MYKTNSPDSLAHSAPLVEFLNTLPSPLTTALVGLAPQISRIRHAVQILTWKGNWEESSLVLALWWALCLVPELGLRYILPFTIPLFYFRMRAHPHTRPSSNITEDTLQRAIADLSAIHALLPAFPTFTHSSQLPSPTPFLRSIIILYIPYLVVAHIVRIRIILAIAGTLVLTWRARWAAVLRSALWRSAHIRWATYRTWSALSGQPLPPKPLSPQSQSDAQLASVSASSAPALPSVSVRFLFTLYENQRWWMGLDWTAALLPGERPSWCSVSQLPAAPPSAFALPAATTAYTLAPDGKRRLKRTARWRWEEQEWRVVVRQEGAAGTSRVERPLPSEREESAAAASAGRILKAAGKMRAPSLDAGDRHGQRERERERESQRGSDEEGAEHAHVGGASDDAADGEGEEPFSDPDGWAYADNKWEGANGKGGMGKYTRFRRWTRIAVLTETVELVDPGALGIRRDDEHVPDAYDPMAHRDFAPAPPPLVVSTQQPQPQAVPSQVKAEGPADRDPSSPVMDGAHLHSPASEDGSRLRARLKAAVLGSSGHA